MFCFDFYFLDAVSDSVMVSVDSGGVSAGGIEKSESVLEDDWSLSDDSHSKKSSSSGKLDQSLKEGAEWVQKKVEEAENNNFENSDDDEKVQEPKKKRARSELSTEHVVFHLAAMSQNERHRFEVLPMEQKKVAVDQYLNELLQTLNFEDKELVGKERPESQAKKLFELVGAAMNNSMNE
jgi:hypothetical protein